MGSETNMFRDVMDIAWKSSEDNGGCDPWTAKQALHMIRSTLSIDLSIDLPLVDLINKVKSAT